MVPKVLMVRSGSILIGQTASSDQEAGISGLSDQQSAIGLRLDIR